MIECSSLCSCEDSTTEGNFELGLAVNVAYSSGIQELQDSMRICMVGDLMHDA